LNKNFTDFLFNLVKECEATEVFDLSSFWANNEHKLNLLTKVIGLLPLNNQDKNIFDEDIHKVLSRFISLNLSEINKTNYSARHKLFITVRTIFDIIINAIHIPKEWDFKGNYKPKDDIENKLNIVLIEEGEKLWDILRYYSLSLSDKKDENIFNLLDLFWVSGKREERLVKWLKKEKIDFLSDNNYDIKEILLNALQKVTPDQILKNCRFNIPVAALFMSLPPPDNIYRCEVGFIVHYDKNEHSSVEQIFHFSDINFPEILSDPDWEKQLTILITKQKVLVSLITESLLRDYLNQDMLHHIKLKEETDRQVEFTQKESKILRMHSEMLSLLADPLERLTNSLQNTQEQTQRLRAILYEPYMTVFASSPITARYFDDGTEIGLDAYSWNIDHDISGLKSQLAVCTWIAIVVGAIYGKEDIHKNVNSFDELFSFIKGLLDNDDQTFIRTSRIIKILLWHHKIIQDNEIGESKENILLEYMNKVFSEEKDYEPDESSFDHQNYWSLIVTLERFKKVLHTPHKDGAESNPFLPLLLMLFSYNSDLELYINDKDYDSFQNTLTARLGFRPFHGIPMPATRYSFILNLFSAVLEYAKKKREKITENTLSGAKIIIIPRVKCSIELTFSSFVFEDMHPTFEIMKAELKDKQGRTQGNFKKPFVNFAARSIAQYKNHNSKSIQMIHDDKQFSTKIIADRNIFKFITSKLES